MDVTVKSNNKSSSAATHEIRSRLAVRKNHLNDCFEVFTKIHGPGKDFKWFQVSEETAMWYLRQFKLTMQIYPGFNPVTGEIHATMGEAN